MPETFEQLDSRVRPGSRFPIASWRLWLVIGLSMLVLIPCVWHRRIEAGDLGSHLYNAWLAQLIGRGQAPGLYIVPQWNNVLADLAFAWLGRGLGFGAAEKIVVGLAVLIFFWGAFAFITVATRREPWFLIPGLAMVAYGYTFQMGFTNYYLSLGLAFWVVAFLWRGRTLDWIVGLALAGLALSAHLMGFTWLVATVGYIKLAQRMTRHRWMLPIAALLAILGIHLCIARIYQTYDPVGWRVFNYVGFDQLVLYSHRYRALAIAVLLLAVLIAVPEAIGQRRSTEFWGLVRIPLELWVMAVFATAMLWDGILVPRYATGFTYVLGRFTSITAVLVFCLLGCVRQHRWHAVALAICAVIFFAWVYQDTGRINKLEVQAESLVNQLPQGARVIQTIFMSPGSRIGATHVLDRACIGRCFSYANYEPASRQFRIRARPGNFVVTASAESSQAMQQGRYTVRAEDVPLAQIYQCDRTDLSRLCLRDLAAGEWDGQGAYIPRY